MLRDLLLPAALLGLATLRSVVASPATPSTVEPTGASTAAIVHLQVTLNGNRSSIGPEVFAGGSAPPAYNTRSIETTYSSSTQILERLTFDRSSADLECIVYGRASRAAGIATDAIAKIGWFTGEIRSPLGTLLMVSTGNILSEAKFTRTRAGAASAKGSAKLSAVHIQAPALGINKSYNGAPKPNEVLYHDDENSIIIYMNRQVTTRVGNTITGLTVDAINIQLHNYKLAGQTISGSIIFGQAIAR